MSIILNIKNVSKTYKSGGQDLTVLDNISIAVTEGSTIAIVGPSGSGKTTLLGLAAGLDRASEGSIELNNIALDNLNEDERASVRNKHVGFIFQNFQLLPSLTALENIMVPLELRGQKNAKPIATDLLQQVGLGNRGHHYPSQLSGGEQQRISLARAFSNSPKILFADEPSGNLDGETSEKIIDMIFNLNKQTGTTLILVTHDLDLAGKTGRIIKLKAGKVASDESMINQY